MVKVYVILSKVLDFALIQISMLAAVYLVYEKFGKMRKFSESTKNSDKYENF